MKHTKKLLCMAISMLMLFSMCVPAMAEGESQLTEVYVVCGEEYSLNGEAIDTSVPGKQIFPDGNGGFVGLNIGMHEPIAIENFEDKAAGTTVVTEAKDTWHSYSNARSGAVFTKEENAIVPNQYLEVAEKAVTISNKETESSTYGAVYSFIDYNAGSMGARETGLTGKISFDFKVRMPDAKNLVYHVDDGDKIRLRLITSSQEKNSSVYYTPIPYIEANISVENGAYYYRTVEKDANGATRWYNKLKLADYNEQWISLRLVVDTNANTYDVYCGNEKMGPGGYATYYGNKTDKTDEQAVCDISAIQFCANNNAVMHLDDFVVSQFDSSKTPVYYSMPEKLTYEIEAGTEIAELKAPATFVTEDGTPAMDGKTIGFLLSGQPESTDMVGKFGYDVQNYASAYVTYDIYKMGYHLNQKFDEYTVKEEWTGVSITEEIDNNVLKITKPSTTKMIFEGPKVTDSIYEAGYKVKFDPWPETEKGNIFIMQLMDGSTPVLDMKHVANAFDSEDKNAGKYNLAASSTYISRDVLVTDGETWNDIRFVIDETKGTADVYCNGVLVNTVALKNSTVDPRQWRIYDYQNVNENDTASIYFDDFWIAKYAGVASVDESDATITVVKGQEAKAYVTTTLTDDTTSKLPIIWDAPVDTSVCGDVTATGTVDGYQDENGNAVTVNATITVIPYPYTISVEGTALTVTKLTNYTPDATIYGAVYDETGKLVSVEILAALDNVTAWEDGVATATLAEAKDYYVFTWNDGIQPLAAAIQ